jgi:hypothetical protein
MPHVPQELKEAHVAWEVGFAKAPKDPQVGLEQGEQTLRPILVHVPTGVFLLRMIDKRVPIAFQRLVATRRVGIEPTARAHCDVGGLLDRLDREIFGRVEDDSSLATDPGDDRGSVFVVMPATGLALLAAPP